MGGGHEDRREKRESDTALFPRVVLEGVSAVAGDVAERPAPVVDFKRIHTDGVGMVSVLVDLVLHALFEVGHRG